MYKPLIAHTITISESERQIIIAALDYYLNRAKDEGQWEPFTDEIDALADRIFHIGADNE